MSTDLFRVLVFTKTVLRVLKYIYRENTREARKNVVKVDITSGYVYPTNRTVKMSMEL